ARPSAARDACQSLPTRASSGSELQRPHRAIRWQMQAHRGADTDRALYRELAAMQPQQRIRQRQTESQALEISLQSGVELAEGLHRLLYEFGAHADAGIAHADADAAVG